MWSTFFPASRVRFFTEPLYSVESVAVMLQNSPGDLSQVRKDLETNKTRLGHMYCHICHIQAKRSYFSLKIQWCTRAAPFTITLLFDYKIRG